MKSPLLSLLQRAAAAAAGIALAAGIAVAQTQVAGDINLPDTPDRVISTADGAELNVYRARVVRTRGSQLTVRFGDDSEEFRYSVPADFPPRRRPRPWRGRHAERLRTAGTRRRANVL